MKPITLNLKLSQVPAWKHSMLWLTLNDPRIGPQCTEKLVPLVIAQLNQRPGPQD